MCTYAINLIGCCNFLHNWTRKLTKKPKSFVTSENYFGEKNFLKKLWYNPVPVHWREELGHVFFFVW